MAIKTFYADTRDLNSSLLTRNEFLDEQARDAFIRDYNVSGSEVFRAGQAQRQHASPSGCLLQPALGLDS